MPWPVLKCHSGMPIFASTASKDCPSSPKKEKAARGRHRSAGGMPRTHLGRSPHRLVGFQVVGRQDWMRQAGELGACADDCRGKKLAQSTVATSENARTIRQKSGASTHTMK